MRSKAANFSDKFHSHVASGSDLLKQPIYFNEVVDIYVKDNIFNETTNSTDRKLVAVQCVQTPRRCITKRMLNKYKCAA
jgi:hypothetical protein